MQERILINNGNYIQDSRAEVKQLSPDFTCQNPGLSSMTALIISAMQHEQ